jgi:hypothetical protein
MPELTGGAKVVMRFSLFLGKYLLRNWKNPYITESMGESIRFGQ